MPAARDRIICAVSADRREVRIRVSGEETSVPPLPDLDSREVDALIRRLIACREAMLPPISRGDPAPGTAVLTSNEMRWWVEPSPVPGHVTFCLLHPGLGWIGQHITPGAVDRLVTEIRQAGTRETRTTRPR